MLWLVLFTVPFAFLAARPGVAASRRVLATALVLFVPVAGPVLAWVARGVRGGKIATEPTAPPRRTRTSPEDVRRMGDLPSVVERLLSADAAERLAALVHLSTVADDESINVLRWTIEHGPNDVVLEAALTLEEIEMRATPKKAQPVRVRPPTAQPVKSPTVIGHLAPQAWQSASARAA